MAHLEGGHGRKGGGGLADVGVSFDPPSLLSEGKDAFENHAGGEAATNHQAQCVDGPLSGRLQYDDHGGSPRVDREAHCFPRSE